MKDGVLDVGVSKNRGTPKSSILIGFSLINHPFWGTIIFGNTHVYIYIYIYRDGAWGLPFKVHRVAVRLRKPKKGRGRLVGVPGSVAAKFAK